MTVRLLSAASVLIAGPHTPPFEDWKEKSWYMFLMSKLSAMARYCMGNLNAMQLFSKQCTPFVKHINATKVRQLLYCILYKMTAPSGGYGGL